MGTVIGGFGSYYNSGGGAGGVLIKLVSTTDPNIPAVRPDGSALIAGDYVKGTGSFPIDAVDTSGNHFTLTSVNDQVVWSGTEWLLNATAFQWTSEVPTYNKTAESISGTAQYQNVINQEFVAEHKKKIDKFSTLPTAESKYIDLIVQYVGTTTTDYTNGFFYKCVNNSGVYSWEAIGVQKEIDVDNVTIEKPLNQLQVKDAGITTGKLADGAVTQAKIGAKAVTAGKLQDKAVTNAKIADNAVRTIHIANANVTEAKLADSAVTTAKVADNAITTAKLADNAVETAKIKNDAVTIDKVADANIATTVRETGTVDTKLTTEKAVRDALNGKVDHYSTMPAASANNLGLIAQYIGATSATYTNGFFYKVVENSGSYTWQNIDVQLGIVDDETIGRRTSDKALEVKDYGLALTKLKKVDVSNVSKVPTVQSDGSFALGNPRQYKVIHAITGETGNDYTWYYLDTPEGTYAKGNYIWDSVNNWTYVSGESTTPGNIFLGTVTNGGSFPTTRPNGSALVIGDYVKPAANSTFPFTIGTVTFDSVRDQAVYLSPNWVLNASPFQRTSDTPVNDKSVESINGSSSSSNYQSAINIENASEINAAMKTGTFSKPAIGKINLTTKNRNGVDIINSTIEKVVFTEDTQTLTNKTIDADNNTITDLTGTNLKSQPGNQYKTWVVQSDGSWALARAGHLVDDVTIEEAGTDKKLQVKDDGITKAKLKSTLFSDKIEAASTDNTIATSKTIYNAIIDAQRGFKFTGYVVATPPTGAKKDELWYSSSSAEMPTGFPIQVYRYDGSTWSSSTESYIPSNLDLWTNQNITRHNGYYWFGNSWNLLDFNVGVDNSTIDYNSANELEVKDAGIVTAKLHDDAVTIEKVHDDSIATSISTNPVNTKLATEKAVADYTKVDDVTIERDTTNGLQVKDGGISLAKLQTQTPSTAKDCVAVVDADGKWILDNRGKYLRVSTFSGVVGDVHTIYYLDTQCIIGSVTYDPAAYIYKSSAEGFVKIGGSDSSTMLVGNVSPGGSFPTSRPDGSSLVLGDYVKPLATATFPFTIGSVTFTSARDTAVYMSAGNWVLNANPYQQTNETPVHNKSTESIKGTSSTAVYQSDINIENVAALKERLLQVDPMPTASTEYDNKIVQFKGTTTTNYKNGYFYKCTNSSYIDVKWTSNTTGAEFHHYSKVALSSTATPLYTDTTCTVYSGYDATATQVFSSVSAYIGDVNAETPVATYGWTEIELSPNAYINSVHLEGNKSTEDIRITFKGTRAEWDALSADEKKCRFGIITDEDIQVVHQYDTLPTATAEYSGNIVQYTGATTTTAPIYKNGHFYKCIEDSSTPGTYYWTESKVGADEAYINGVLLTGDKNTENIRISFKGTRAEWNALSTDERKCRFGIITDEDGIPQLHITLVVDTTTGKLKAQLWDVTDTTLVAESSEVLVRDNDSLHTGEFVNEIPTGQTGAGKHGLKFTKADGTVIYVVLEDTAGILITASDTATITNKTISADDNTINNIDASNLKVKTAADAGKAFVIQSDGTWALGKAGNEVDNVTIDLTSDEKLEVKDEGISLTKLKSEETDSEYKVFDVKNDGTWQVSYPEVIKNQAGDFSTTLTIASSSSRVQTINNYTGHKSAIGTEIDTLTASAYTSSSCNVGATVKLVACNGSKIVALGSDTIVDTTDTSCLYWNVVSNPAPGEYASLIYGDKFVALPNTGNTHTLYSDDGHNWNTGDTVPDGAYYALAFGNGTYVGVAQSSDTCVTSTDGGITWTTVTLPTTATWSSIAFGNGRFVLVANNTNIGYYSDDNGTTWTSMTIPATASRASVAYGNGKFVLMLSYNKGMATSTDGITWNFTSCEFSGIFMSLVYTGGMFFMTQYYDKGFMFSTDGEHWEYMLLHSAGWWHSVACNGVNVVVSSMLASSSLAFSAISDLKGVKWTNTAGETVTLDDYQIGLNGFTPATSGDTLTLTYETTSGKFDYNKSWVGPKSEYNAITTKDSRTVYYVEGSGVFKGTTKIAEVGNITPDNVTIDLTSDNKMKVKDAGLTVAKINTSALATSSTTGAENTKLATQGYVDDKLSLTGGTMTGDITMSNSSTITGLPDTPTTDSEASSKKYVDTKAAEYLPLTGGTLTGDLELNSSSSTTLTGVIKTANTGSTRIYGGSTQSTGASLVLHSSNYSSYEWRNTFTLETGSGGPMLVGKSDGTLTWNGNPLGTSITVLSTRTTPTVSGWYYIQDEDSLEAFIV